MALAPGHYFPRIGRGPWGHRLSPFNAELVSARQQLKLLHEDLNSIFTYVQPDRSNQSVYGHHIRNLLILASTEFEAQCMGVLRANDAQPIGRNFNTNDYVKLNSAMKLFDYELELSMFPDYPKIKPFANWGAACPTGSLTWYDAYNKTKHNRELEFASASLENAISSVAATTALFMAQILGTDCNSPTLMLPRTFIARMWPGPFEEGRYIEPEDRTTWIPVKYKF